MPLFINYVLYLVLGPHMSQEIAALKALDSVQALVNLLEKLMRISNGVRMEITDKDITAGLEELKSILNLRVDNDKTTNDKQRLISKFGNQMIVNGCYQTIIDFLFVNGYKIKQ